jgi:dihydroflavonol-4-reductase
VTKRVLLTGITGYIGQYCAAELLKQGYEVVGTIRSQTKAQLTKSDIAKICSVDRLSFVEADLLSDKGWAEAMRGCMYVMHVASPCEIVEPKDENEFIIPALVGTKRIISFAQNLGVKRLVVTSSIAAMIAGKDTGRYGTESWSNSNANIGAYMKSKTLAERAAWKAIESGGTLELVVINPGGVFGPSLGSEIKGQTLKMVHNFINGKTPMIPDVAMGMIDVRDVARLHVKALSADGAIGKRFIASSAEPIEFATLAKILRDLGYNKVPTRIVPSILLKMISLFDREAKGLLPFLGKKASFDNQATFEILDWEPTPIETSIRDMAEMICKYYGAN